MYCLQILWLRIAKFRINVFHFHQSLPLSQQTQYCSQYHNYILIFGQEMKLPFLAAVKLERSGPTEDLGSHHSPSPSTLPRRFSIKWFDPQKKKKERNETTTLLVKRERKDDQGSKEENTECLSCKPQIPHFIQYKEAVATFVSSTIPYSHE